MSATMDTLTTEAWIVAVVPAMAVAPAGWTEAMVLAVDPALVLVTIEDTMGDFRLSHTSRFTSPESHALCYCP